jgi:hypothetical protein
MNKGQFCSPRPKSQRPPETCTPAVENANHAERPQPFPPKIAISANATSVGINIQKGANASARQFIFYSTFSRAALENAVNIRTLRAGVNIAVTSHGVIDASSRWPWTE